MTRLTDKSTTVRVREPVDVVVALMRTRFDPLMPLIVGIPRVNFKGSKLHHVWVEDRTYLDPQTLRINGEKSSY